MTLDLVCVPQVHPTPIGRVLFTDLVMAHLLQHLDPDQTWDPQNSSRYKETWAGRYPPPQRYLPPKEIEKGGRQIFSQRCYGHTDFANSRTGDLGNLNVLSMDGFEYTEYQINGDTKKRKPGWVATEPGSEIIFRVDTRFSMLSKASPPPSPNPPSNPLPPNASLPPFPPSDAPRQRPFITMMFLHSYEHMGRALISCVAGCECYPQEENVSTNHFSNDALSS